MTEIFLVLDHKGHYTDHTCCRCSLIELQNNYFFFVLNVCATEPACEMTGFAVAKLMSVVTRQTLRGCYNNNEEASVNAVVHSRVKIGDMVNEVDLRSFIQLVLGV